MTAERPEAGFGSPPIPTYIFVGESDDVDSSWYELDFETKKKIPIKQEALWCTITGLKLVKKIWRDEPVIKLDISVMADKKYVIRSSVDTLFSRGFLLAAQTLDDFEEMICIVVSKGDQQNAIFCRLFYTNGSRVKAEWNKDIKLLPIIQNLQRRLDIPVQDYNAVLAGAEYNESNQEDDHAQGVQPPPPSQPAAQVTQSLPQEEVKTTQPPSQAPVESQPIAIAPLTETEKPQPQIKVAMPELIAPDKVPVEQQIPAPIARQARTLSAEYYSTEVDDAITLPLLGKIRSLARILKIDDVQESIKVMGSDVTDLSVKGGEHLIAHLNRLVDEASK